MHWVRNVASTGGWSFAVTGQAASRRALMPGEDVVISGEIKNNGVRGGTAYVVVTLARTYHHDHVIFDSHETTDENVRTALRLTDIPVGVVSRFAVTCRVPFSCPADHVDMRIQVWNPHRLYGGPHEYCFHDTGWKGSFEVLRPTAALERRVVFVSYSWQDREWVAAFVDELRRQNITVILDRTDLFAGTEITRFMETALRTAHATILVCSSNYTEKANARQGGVGFETVISSAMYLQSTEKDIFIPVIRNNDLPAGRKMPTYLGSTKYVPMEDEDWRAEPMQELLRAIDRVCQRRAGTASTDRRRC